MVRKCTWILGLLAAVAVALVLIPFAGAGITGSAHDFSGETWNTDGEICAPCHTPHNADTTVTAAPLWDRATLGTTTYTLYSSSTLDASDLSQPGGASKLCMSCHDGTISLDSFGGTTGGTDMITGDAQFTDLEGHHPVSFTYNAALATTDGELHDPTTTSSGIAGGGNIDADMLFMGTTVNDQMECASCHDVHDSASQEFLLVKSNAASALCLTCHDK